MSAVLSIASNSRDVINIRNASKSAAFKIFSNPDGAVKTLCAACLYDFVFMAEGSQCL